MDKEKNMKTLDLTKILKVGDKVWSPIIGECIVKSFMESTNDYIIVTETFDGKHHTTFTKEGKYFDFSPETTLFPSKDHRVWDDEAIMIIRPPKKGDYLISEIGNPFIFNGEDPRCYGRIVARDSQGDLLTEINEESEHFTNKARYATSEEIKEFDEFLKSKGYYFDKEKLELMRIKWRAMYGIPYWFISSIGTVMAETEVDSVMDGKRYELGNYFKTETEALKALKQVKQLYKDIQDGNN